MTLTFRYNIVGKNSLGNALKFLDGSNKGDFNNANI